MTMKLKSAQVIFKDQTLVTEDSARIEVHDDGGNSLPIQLTIEGYWFGEKDLRELAVALVELADGIKGRK